MEVIALALIAAVASVANGQNEEFFQCLPGISSSIGGEKNAYESRQSVIYNVISVTIPKGDVNVEVGSEPFALYCRLNPYHDYYTKSKLDSSNLEFALAGEDGVPVPLTSNVVNDTTIVATFQPGSRKRMDLIRCLLNIGRDQQRGVCQQNVYVGGELGFGFEAHVLLSPSRSFMTTRFPPFQRSRNCPRTSSAYLKIGRASTAPGGSRTTQSRRTTSSASSHLVDSEGKIGTEIDLLVWPLFRWEGSYLVCDLSSSQANAFVRIPCGSVPPISKGGGKETARSSRRESHTTTG